MKLSDNFALEEFLVSQTATRMGRDVIARNDVIEYLNILCNRVLQPIRDHLTSIHPDIRMHISSGYRPVWLNKAIGGSRTSAHCCGEKSKLQEAAADWGISGAPEGFTLFDAAREAVTLDLPYDQIIYEGNWIHTGWRQSPRGEILTATFSKGLFGKVKTTYHNGLIKP